MLRNDILFVESALKIVNNIAGQISLHLVSNMIVCRDLRKVMVFPQSPVSPMMTCMSSSLDLSIS